jgi:hypothetical protein
LANKSSMMQSGLTCPFAIWQKLNITLITTIKKMWHLSIHNDIQRLCSCFQTIYIL